MTKTPNIHDLINAAAAATDFTQEQSGGSFERELPEAGMAVARLREYIELGVQPTASKMYPDKKPALKARFVFELTTPKHIKVIERDGMPVIRIPHILSVECVISASEKSNFIKLFRQLNWDGTNTHPAQCLGKPYLVEVVHAWEKGADKKKDKPKYANIQKDGMYTISAPRKVDPLAGTVEELAVPEMLNTVKLFLWAMPTQDTWDSLFIDGTYEKDGKEVSKNWLQEKILGAMDFETSALATLVGGLGDLGKPADTAVPPAAETEPTASPSKGGAPDPLAGLGL